MDRKVTILFLWHMHQPYYKDTIENYYVMPWVRLHATKGYYDIPLVMEKYGIRGTINMVPSLLEQIEDYVNNEATDRWMELTQKDPDEMNDEEKGFVLENFFMLNWERLVHTSHRYGELLSKREDYRKRFSFIEMGSMFSRNEILDLQVLFNLKWFGFMAREHYPFLRLLEEKDRFFTTEDKRELLRIQKGVLKDIIPLYRRLMSEEKLEVSFTPFYHPIFPLVYDTDISKRSAPSAPMPQRFFYPRDARWHLEEGKRYSERIWGRKLSGMWPAEGSVSPEIVPVASENGVKWMATDDGILFRSINNFDKSRILYKPYRVRSENSEVVTFFRDKYLSDLIGFSFSRMDTGKAVDIFMRYVESVASHFSEDRFEKVLPVILDGENAWESYPGNGKDFLSSLFQRITAATTVTSNTFSGYLEGEDLDTFPMLNRLYSGSWINSDYRIWIGGMQENTAWNYLKKVRDFWEDYRIKNPSMDEENVREVLYSLYRAEGSDWFWWYGETFSTENDYLFDRLFRRHLRKVYKILSIESPSFLDVPISGMKKVEIFREPSAFISPQIDGMEECFYSWCGSGEYDNSIRPGGSMYDSNRIVDKFYYGFDKENLYFKLTFSQPVGQLEDKRCSVKFFIANGREADFVLPLRRFEKSGFGVVLGRGSEKFAEAIDVGRAAFSDVLESSVPFKSCNLIPGSTVSLHLKVFASDGAEIERIPDMGMIDITVPDRNFLLQMWDV